MNKPTIHFIAAQLTQPTNPITINVIGAGGTGSQVIAALARINKSFHQLNHPGLQVNLFDDDIVTLPNIGRQLFAEPEIGLNKAVALINRFNRFFGTAWRAVPHRYTPQLLALEEDKLHSNITISCVDKGSERFTIADTLKNAKGNYYRYQPFYWMDFGNSKHTGQVILSTVGDIQQPKSKKFQPVTNLPFITNEFPELILHAESDDTPSCSLAEALLKQDLFINSTLAHLGASLLWKLLREGFVCHRGVFLNLQTFCTTPIGI